MNGDEITAEREDGLCIVGIGASAGGLEAIREMLMSLDLEKERAERLQRAPYRPFSRMRGRMQSHLEMSSRYSIILRPYKCVSMDSYHRQAYTSKSHFTRFRTSIDQLRAPFTNSQLIDSPDC